MSDRFAQREEERRRQEKARMFVFIGYAGEPGNYPLYECADCGCAVTATNTHIDWHTKILTR